MPDEQYDPQDDDTTPTDEHPLADADRERESFTPPSSWASESAREEWYRKSGYTDPEAVPPTVEEDMESLRRQAMTGEDQDASDQENNIWDAAFGPMPDTQDDDTAADGYQDAQFELGSLFQALLKPEPEEAVTLTDVQQRVTMIANNAASILQSVSGKSMFAPTNRVSATEIALLADWMLSAGLRLEPRKVDVSFSDIPTDLPPGMLEVIKERIMNGERGFMGPFPSRTERDPQTGVKVDEHGGVTTEVEEDGRTWHYLPATKLIQGTITPNFTVLTEPMLTETELGPQVTAEIQAADGSRHDGKWAAYQEVKVLCPACTFRAQMGR